MTELQIKPEDIRSAIERNVANFNPKTSKDEVGRVAETGDGIARVEGLPSAMTSELLEFEGGLLGVALNLDVSEIGAVLLGDPSGIQEGQEVRRTGRVLEVPVGDGFLGRTVDPLGNPIDGLGAIKGVGEQAMQSVIDSRIKEGPYKDLFDFCHRIDLKKINKRTLEALIRAGALDCLGIERSSLMAQLPEAVQAADQARSNRETGIMDLFGEVEEVQRKPAKPVKPWSDEVRLKGEKDTLGLYLTGHPIDVYRPELKSFIPAKLNELTPTRRGVTTVFSGLVVDIANFPNRIMITLDDGTARVEISCNHERFQRYKDIVRLEQVIVIEGEIYEREGFDRPMARLSKAFSLNEIRQKRAQSIQIRLAKDLMSKSLAKDLQTMLLPYCNVDMCQHIGLQIQLEQSFATAELHLGAQWKVVPLDELLSKLRDYFGKEAIFIEYQVKSKAAKVVEAPKIAVVAPPPKNMSMDEALDLYQAEISQYS